MAISLPALEFTMQSMHPDDINFGTIETDRARHCALDRHEKILEPSPDCSVSFTRRSLIETFSTCARAYQRPSP
jgi:hypothetical protein